MTMLTITRNRPKNHFFIPEITDFKEGMLGYLTSKTTWQFFDSYNNNNFKSQ